MGGSLLPDYYCPGDRVIKMGVKAESMFLIQAGHVVVMEVGVNVRVSASVSGSGRVRVRVNPNCF